ncbi:AAA family ATPase [Pseudonocardia sp. GCM10023141]|uniref:AAA family ATPase n=1 Tax=Pseudonocardia sp. GCM10023141 TaxID=3252653 RepID=UPI00361FF869
MKPVRLEMAGFASFREATVVDFEGAEYFALVGPTGAGKSTIIDALTFALYGSVPRWDDRRAVALALAPTVNRGTVRLVFDVGGARYVAAREIRRAASGSVAVRTARLERLRDPRGLGTGEEETEPLADGAGPVTKAVEELLGLPFGDFCTCVVLPQGDFAEFLHTEPRKRQEKLVRILGLGVYDVIAREANSEAAAQRQRAEILGEQLGGYADATAEAEQAATARVEELGELAERVDAAVPELGAAAATLQTAQGEVTRIEAERVRLTALTVPSGLVELSARHSAAGSVESAAAARAAAGEAADTAAREALAAAPARAPLEQVRRDHAELAGCVAELPGARERQEKALAAYDDATRDAADARVALDAARVERDAAAAALATATERGRSLVAERDGLRSLTIPAGLDALDRRRADTAAASEATGAALADAEYAETRARSALAAAPQRGPLEQARREHQELAAARAEAGSAAERLTAARARAATASQQLDEARRHLEHARKLRAEGAATDLAAALRPQLAVGHDCPVCARSVTTLPPPLPATDLDAAERAVSAAEQAFDAAGRDDASAAAAVTGAAADAERATTAVTRLESALAAFPDPAAVASALAEVEELTAVAVQSDAAVRAARSAREAAQAAAESVRVEVTAATAALRTARDPLVPFGAPAHDDDDVLAGWAALVSWARTEAGVRDRTIAEARTAATALQRERDTAEQALQAADRGAQERRQHQAAAARAELEARGAADALERRAAQLRATLATAPSDAEAAAELERRTALEEAARAADTEMRAARAAQRAAEQAAAEIDREVAAAWNALRAARDPLVPLGAPAATGDGDLAGAWAQLSGWAAAEAADRAGLITAAQSAVATAAATRDALDERLATDLAAHDVTARSPLAATAIAAVAAVLERARGARERIAERRAAVASITADRDEAESAQQVAKMLGNLLRSDGFPRWLVASALDALVADASTSLAELSGGQFELTHAGGEFLIIDHTDADTRRPVKTLSGGETFQASLALALALSAQMSGLAARGAARLESIFLDEGFGTLDEANLEVVASTLENLAARGDRMVGVVTHVPALAERVPVRFVVSRDQRTSSVVRENV